MPTSSIPDPERAASRERAVITAAVALLVGLTVLVLGGQSLFVMLLLLSGTAALLHYGPRLDAVTPRGLLDPQEPPPPVPVLPNGPHAIPLNGWSDAELCLAWQASYVQLQRRTGAAWIEHLAEQRRTYLNELQRRDPTGFATWIASGARAASDPTRYLTGPHRTL
jgi:hypothetical protein